jgi:hypothetical protein
MSGAVGCGGKAADGDEHGLGGAPFLAACEPQRCLDGLECSAGVCTRSCSEDGDCSNEAPGAQCRALQSSEPGHSVCSVRCSSHYSCRHLGAGSYCDGTSCVADDLAALPAAFERLELRRVPEAVQSEPFPPCQQNELSTRVEVNLRSVRLSWSTCGRGDEADGAGFDVGQRALADDDVERVVSAYRQLRPSTTARCLRGEPSFTLDLEAERNFELLFADAEHSACPDFDLRRGSFLAGLDAFYGALEALTGVGQ